VFLCSVFSRVEVMVCVFEVCMLCNVMYVCLVLIMIFILCGLSWLLS